MSMQCELMEAEAVAGRVFDVDCFGQLCDRLGRCLQRLGLKRVPRPVNDGSQALADYFAAPLPKDVPVS
jgi:hypothetical protein